MATVSAKVGSRKPLPPYAREVLELLAAGRPVNCFIYAGAHRWERAKNRRTFAGPGSAIVLPVGAEPASFTWPPITNPVVDGSELSDAERHAIGSALVEAGAFGVWLLDFNRAAMRFVPSWDLAA